jgi:hypothetical protein
MAPIRPFQQVWGNGRLLRRDGSRNLPEKLVRGAKRKGCWRREKLTRPEAPVVTGFPA